MGIAVHRIGHAWLPIYLRYTGASPLTEFGRCRFPYFYEKWMSKPGYINWRRLSKLQDHRRQVDSLSSSQAFCEVAGQV
jgi:hypothetical protein